MAAGVYSRLVEAHRLAVQLEAKIDFIRQDAMEATAAELQDVSARIHAAQSKLLGLLLLVQEALQKTEARP